MGGCLGREGDSHFSDGCHLVYVANILPDFRSYFFSHQFCESIVKSAKPGETRKFCRLSR